MSWVNPVQYDNLENHTKEKCAYIERVVASEVVSGDSKDGRKWWISERI